MLQKGRRVRSLSIILFASIPVVLFSSLGAGVSTGRGAYTTGVMPVGGAASFGGHRRHSNVAYGPAGKPRPQKTASGTTTKVTTASVKPADAGPNLYVDLNVTTTNPAIRFLDPSTSPGTSGQGTIDRVVFVSNGIDANGDGVIDSTPLPAVGTNGYNGALNIWTMVPDGSGQIELNIIGTTANVDKRWPVYDPGGRLITYSAYVNGQWDIYTTNIASGVTQAVTTGAGNKLHPTWSPDSLYIAFACENPAGSGQYAIARVLANGSQTVPTFLTSGPNDTEPSWSPTNANLLVYTHLDGNVTHIYSINPNAAPPTPVQLTNGGGVASANDKQAIYRRDGVDIAFASTRDPSGATDAVGYYSVWWEDASGEASGSATATLLSADPAGAFDTDYPAWITPLSSRVGLQVFYHSLRQPPAPYPVSNPDHIWSTTLEDDVPPVLVDLPWVDNRQPQAGSPIQISAQLYDADSGVAHVYAIITNPDSKIYQYAASHQFDSPTGSVGTQAIEVGYNQVTAPIELFDDGTGRGVFTASWTTLAAPEDYVLGIRATDNAGNQITYDSIYGFSTKPFTPANSILFVNDFCEGQAFISQYDVVPPGQQPQNNAYLAAYMCESFYTSNPGEAPLSVNTIDFNSIRDYAPSQQGYDIWRVICRGPIPSAIYQYYLPTVENQLSPSEAISSPATAAPDTVVQVANRALIWACPHAGDVWIGSSHPSNSVRPSTADPNGSGSLVDPATQSAVTSFLTSGGRITISGEDLVWALTLNGTVANNFVTGVLHCSFVNDIAGGNDFPIYGYTMSAVNPATDPVAYDPWVGTGLHGPHNQSVNFDPPISFETPKNFNAATDPSHADANNASQRPDQITANTSTEALYTYGDANGAGTGASGTAAIRYADAATGARVVFLAFNFDQVHRQYSTYTIGSTTINYCQNRRSIFLHNCLCWERTGALQGRVLSVAGNAPITNPNPIVLFWRSSDAATSPPDYAVRCQNNGTYVVNGLQADFYRVEVIVNGYNTAHFNGQFVHGGWTPFTLDFAVNQPSPAAVTGVVTSQASGQAVPGIWVHAYQQPTTGSAPYTTAQLGAYLAHAQTDASGSYTLPNLQVAYFSNYVIVANDSGSGDPTNANYGTSTQQPVTLTTGNTATVNLTLPAAPGSMTVQVQGTNPNAPPPTLFLTSTVQVINPTTGVVVASGTTTSTTGNLVTSPMVVPPGTYSVTISADGYQAQTIAGVTINPNANTDLGLITLTPQPPGVLSGRITSATTGLPVPGVTVNIIGASQTYTVTTFAITSTDPTTPNYTLNPCPTGTYTVQPVPNGFTATPTQRTGIVVTSGNTTSGVNFVLSALHTFSAALQFMSTPYDYSTVDPATLLNISPATLSGEMATWLTSAGAYKVYPNYPADFFYPGRGYWLNTTTPIDIRQNGGATSDPFVIHLGNGWNMIGSPYDSLRIDLYQTTFTDTQGTYSFSSALANGKVTTLLYAYVLGGYQTVNSMTPWVGYWLHTSEAIDMTITHAMGTSAAQTTQSTRPVVTAPDGGWVMPITASAGGYVDGSAYIGMAPKAATTYQPGVDMLKPPLAAMGPYVYAALTEQSWGANSGAYAIDVKPSDAGGQTWDLDVSTNQIGANVTVAWPDMNALPATVRPVLVDVASGRKTYMRTSCAYTFQATDAQRHLQVVIDNAQNAPLAVTAMNAQQAGAAVTIAYTLSCAASVDVQIRNISGVLVRTVTTGQLQTAGTNQTLWNCRNDAGRLVPAGRYLVTLTACTDEGQQTNSIMSLTVGR